MKENKEESSNGIETTPPMTQLCQKSSKGKEPITQLSQPRAATMLKDINNTKELWKIAVKVKDIWQVVKDGKESFELVVVDSKGDDITIIVPHELNAKFNTLIIEKNSYTIQNFQVLKNDDQFKQSQHQFKLRLTGGTRVFDVNQHDIPYPMAKFKDFLEIEEGIWRQDFLYDVIGVVDDIGYTQRFQGSKKVQINFRLRDVSNNKIRCTLWENYATQLITYMDEKTDAGGTIVCMKYAKIKPAGKFPLTVSNTWTTTKLFINDKIPEILNFQKSLDEAISNGFMTAVVNTSSQLMSQSSGSSMYTPEQKFVQNHEIMPLSQMCCLTRDTACVTVVKTVKVRSNNKGWYFQACYKCPKAVSGDKPPYKCGDNHPTETQIWKYRLNVDVKYENTESTFTFWDREVAQLLEVTAADLRDQCHDIGLTDPLDYPTIIDKIEGKTIAVRVKWQPKWKNGSVNEVHNGPDFIENLIDQFNGPTQDKKSAVPNDSAVSENNTPSKSITASLDVVIPMVSLSGTDEIDPEVVSMKTPSKRNGASILSCAENDETHELIASNASSTKMAKHQKMEEL